MSTTLQRIPSMPSTMGRAPRLPLLEQIGLLTWRALLVNLRVPAVFVPPLVISAFTLIIYQAQLGDAAKFFLQGQSYLGFILPLSVVSASLSGASVAGQTIVNDITRGYFNKLSLTPVSRWALLLGPMLANAILVVFQAVTIILIGLLLGLKPVTGIGGLLAVVGFALLLGVAFSGLTVGIALLTGNAAATGGAVFLFFPLTFLTATFVPVDQLQGWFKVAARLNPVTYFLEAMRSILNSGWESAPILHGLIAGAAMFVVLFAFALYSLRARTRRL